MLFPRSLALTSLAAITLLAGCADKEEVVYSNYRNPVYQIPTKNLSEAQQLAKNATVECSSIGTCSPSVGLLSFATSQGASQCSASVVIESDVVVTNSHCIPEQLKTPGSSCKDHIWMNFAQNGGYTKEQVDCGSVILASSISGEIGEKPDYAFIRLARPSTRPPLRTSHEGFLDESIYYVNKVDPTGRSIGKVMGRQMSVPCKAIYGSDLMESFVHPQAKVALMTECEVIPGNSGGPILDASGAIRGVIFATFNTANMTSLNRRKLGNRSLVKMGLGTNFACINYAGESSFALPATCANAPQVERNETERRKGFYANEEESAFRRMMAEEVSPEIQDFQWKKVNHSYGGPEFSIHPTCVVAGAVGKYAQPVEVSLPRWDQNDMFDQYMRKRLEITPLSRLAGKLTVTPGADGNFEANLELDWRVRRLSIPLCP